MAVTRRGISWNGAHQATISLGTRCNFLHPILDSARRTVMFICGGQRLFSGQSTRWRCIPSGAGWETGKQMVNGMRSKKREVNLWKLMTSAVGRNHHNQEWLTEGDDSITFVWHSSYHTTSKNKTNRNNAMAKATATTVTTLTATVTATTTTAAATTIGITGITVATVTTIAETYL